MKLNACDAPPDLGLHWGLHRSLQQLEKPAAALRSSARRPRHATEACDAGLTAGSAWADPPRGGRAARRYARTFSPGRSAATIAARGQRLLWGTTATQTRHETGEQTLPGTQPNAYSQTRTQRNALGRNATW